MRRLKKTKIKSSKYIKKPPRNPAVCFFTSFLLTLTLLGALGGIMVADSNSTGLGWNRAGEVFSYSENTESYDFTIMGENVALDKSAVDKAQSICNKIFDTYSKVCFQIDTEPSYLIGVVIQELTPSFKKIVSICEQYL